MNGKLINFKDIKYDPFWYKKYKNIFLKQKSSLLIDNRDFFKHTYKIGVVNANDNIFTNGYGPFLKTKDGKIMLDFASGVYVTNFGHAHPKVGEAISRQAKKLLNVHDYMTDIKASYFEKLYDFFDTKYNKFYIYDNGTTSVEFAIRLARNITGKYEILSFYSDHHGKTMGASSLGRLNKTHRIAREDGFYLLPRPNKYRPLWIKKNGEIDTDKYIEFYELSIKEQTTGNIAAIIAEPIQGWGGSIVPPDDFFPKLSKLCLKHNILLIVDEILTGFGRTGKKLSIEHWNITPDIVIIGKGMGNGFPMSGMLLKEKYAQYMKDLAPSTTFAANPLACAAGLSVLEIFEENNILENVNIISEYIFERLYAMKEKFEIIGDVRGKGLLIGIEFVKNRQNKKELSNSGFFVYEKCIANNFIPGFPVLNMLRIAPPLIIDLDIAKFGMDILENAIKCLQEVENDKA